RMLNNYDLVTHYDVGRGLRLHAGDDPQRLTRMNALLTRIMGGTVELPREPIPVLRLIDRLVTLLLVSGSTGQKYKTACLFDFGEMICPPGDYHNENLALLLNWARSPIIRRVNLIFILMTSGLAQLHPALAQSGYTAEIRLPMPAIELRRQFVRQVYAVSEPDADRLSSLSAGLTIANLDQLLRLTGLVLKPENRKAVPPAESSTSASGIQPAGGTLTRLETRSEDTSGPEATTKVGSWQNDQLTQVKKQLIEAQCPGLIEFVEPHLNLDLIAGHEMARRRLAEDARLILDGHLEAVPMGYLICGPVGVGKTFLAMCYAGTVGIPCVTIRNFRSKYVGETEANLEKILNVLRELGPVAVIIDEADAAVGDRAASGDSGTSARVFAQLAGQMGDTRYRGRIIWFMLT
ncbi:MAG: AAA family ATPase, partial [Deltaproteobacteria bacterium]|nr:AAA family ATPase [Deltaproteobacteria bacterium]